MKDDIRQRYEGPSPVDLTTEQWGGRIPEWEEFRDAVNGGRVEVDKRAAHLLIKTSVGFLPFYWRLFFYYILPWIALLLIPSAVIAFFLDAVGVWAIFASGPLVWLVGKISYAGQREGIKWSAYESSHMYNELIHYGAFTVLAPISAV